MPRRSQEDRSRTTRAALVDTAYGLFAERGYAAVSLDEIVTAAGVTRGAVYHHYGDKQALFRAVFEKLEAELMDELRTAVAAAPDPSAAMGAALGRFLDVCRRPDVVRIGLTDGPAVLGWQTWREIEREHALGLIIAMLEQDGRLAGAPIPVLAQLVLSAAMEAALTIANAEDPAARADAEQALRLLFSGTVNPPT